MLEADLLDIRLLEWVRTREDIHGKNKTIYSKSIIEGESIAFSTDFDCNTVSANLKKVSIPCGRLDHGIRFIYYISGQCSI